MSVDVSRLGRDDETARREPLRRGPDNSHAAVRFMLYSHDGLGLGHFRRNLVIARALTEHSPEASVLLACSAEGIETFSLPPGVDVLRLPGLRKVTNGEYVGRRLRIAKSEVLRLRAGLLASAVTDFRPDVLVADKHPLGLSGELLPALQMLHDIGGRAVLGLRDVLDDPAAAADEWRATALGRRASQIYDMALIYGSANLLSPIDDGLLPPRLAARARFVGYVVGQLPDETPPPLPRTPGQPVVLATVGGGEDGYPVLEAFLGASREGRWRGVLIAGPQMAADDWARLESTAADAGVAAFQSVRGVQHWYRDAAALVCMGGYNTLAEALAAPVPTVCVPRIHPRQEQLIRARAFADRGLLEVVGPDALTPGSLSAAISRAIGTTRAALTARVGQVMELGGADRAAHLLVDLARQRAAA